MTLPIGTPAIARTSGASALRVGDEHEPTVLWYLDKQHFISHATKQASVTYEYLVAISPAVMSFISNLLPFFGDVFQQLEELFRKLPSPHQGGANVVV